MATSMDYDGSIWIFIAFSVKSQDFYTVEILLNNADYKVGFFSIMFFFNISTWTTIITRPK